MSKKTKRQVSRSKTSLPAAQAETTAATIAMPKPRRSSLSEEFNPDYSTVIKDLKCIFMFAGSFFVVLIVLSFIIK